MKDIKHTPPFSEKSASNLYTVAFYNLENLFDTRNNPNTLDDDFTPGGEKRWDDKRYQNKIYKLGKAISEIGYQAAKTAPSIVGLAEVENQYVLQDLIDSENLNGYDMGYVHFNSPDERGIDTALLYRKRDFEVINSEAIPLLIDNVDGARDYTRDILYVKGVLNHQEVHVLVNHWPSRRDGAAQTDYKRIEAAKTIHSVMDGIKEEEADPNVIIMGDFNDDPMSTSIKDHLMLPDLYNPMSKLMDPFNKGSLSYRSRWNLFDQIIFTNNFFEDTPGTHSFAHADVFDKRFLRAWNGRFKGNPFRTFAGRKYLGGYSDHFPVYVLLRKNE
ncbi:Endonuclease/Exonuclease/phosphatase family protein [Zhouia amylolytica]|uniref:Endonuclease/Exonuclease/phosphatase family protein n=1 Tax=Zhouia amylolytica TaxID=376730 RepID=A0A1I6PJZ6_9FLAO|nr:endonuclease/exonuclease/phosphatase family protein [Zhouia amylolytica]SFS40499.1 Endonuclease/Exonuclease/phosphatase family protein [Zhouia amylolytica]